jgi:MraZ protein
MSRFRGAFTYSLDEKGRVSIPARFRKALSPEAQETFIVSRGPNGCLRAFPLDEWDKKEDSLKRQFESADTVRAARHIQSTLSESVLDSQGRISLSADQVAIAGINRNVLLIGNPGFVELWDPERFKAYMGPDDDFDKAFYQSVDTQMKAQPSR